MKKYLKGSLVNLIEFLNLVCIRPITFHILNITKKLLWIRIAYYQIPVKTCSMQ